MESKEELLLKSLLNYYSNPEHLYLFIRITSEDQLLSLRSFDYFTTNYAKYNKVYLNDRIDVYTSYKNNLKSYRKRYFDPFRRRNQRNCILLKVDANDLEDLVNYKGPIKIEYESIECDKVDKYKFPFIITTVCQLNYFRWCFTKGIVEALMKNNLEIQKSMDLQKTQKKNKSGLNKNFKNKGKESEVHNERQFPKTLVDI